MTLTVPRAGINPGRAAAPRVEAGQAGAAAAQLGQSFQRIGGQLEADRLSREMNRMQVDLTRDINRMRLDLEAIGDPDQLETEFASRRDALKSSYLSGQRDNGRPMVDPRNRERFDLVFDGLANNAELAIGRRALAGRLAQRESTYLEYAHTATVAAASSDAAGRDGYLQQGEAMIAELQAAGVINAEEATRRRQALASDMEAAAAIELINSDPGAFLDAVDEGEFTALGGVALARYKANAQNRVDAEAAKTERNSELELAAAQKQIGTQLDEMVGIWNADQRAANEDEFLTRPDVMAHPKYPEAMAQRALLLEMPALNLMTPAQLREQIAVERATPKTREFQSERLTVLERKLESEERAWAADPIAHARAKGFNIPSLPDFDANDPQAYVRALRGSTAASAALVDQGWTDNDAVFDASDLKAIRQTLTATENPRDRAVLAQSIVAGLADRPDVIDEIAGDPVFQLVGRFGLAGGHAAVSEDILQGQQMIDAGTVELPPVRDRLQPTFDAVEDLFVDIPGGPRIQSATMAAADALYAARQGRVDPAGNIDEGLYRQALHEVMGGTGKQGTRRARGGLQEVNGQLTMLPIGVSVDMVETSLANIGQVSVTRNRRATNFNESQMSEDLAEISANGEPPVVDGRQLDARTFEAMQMRAVRDGVYEFFYVNNAGEVLVPQTPSGAPYRFKMNDLLLGFSE